MAVLRKLLKIVVLGVFFLLGLWVVQDNPQPVQVRLLGLAAGSLPLGVWLLLVFALGAGLGLLAGLPSSLRSARERRKTRKQLEKARSQSGGGVHTSPSAR